MPALIEHLDDDRLTRTTMTGFNDVWPMRVQHMVSDLLEGLAAEELGTGHRLGKEEVGGIVASPEGYPVTKRAAKEWWEKARKVGEEDYLKDRVLPAPATGRKAVAGQSSTSSV